MLHCRELADFFFFCIGSVSDPVKLLLLLIIIWLFLLIDMTVSPLLHLQKKKKRFLPFFINYLYIIV